MCKQGAGGDFKVRLNGLREKGGGGGGMRGGSSFGTQGLSLHK